MYFCVNEFEVGVNDSIFSGNEQQKMSFYYDMKIGYCVDDVQQRKKFKGW